MEKTDHDVQEKYSRLKNTYLSLRDMVIGNIVKISINGPNCSQEINVFRDKTNAFIKGIDYFNEKINDVAGSLCVNNDKPNSAMQKANRSMSNICNKIVVLESLTPTTPEIEINARKAAINKILEEQIRLQQSIIREVFENSWQNANSRKSANREK